jgi:hypothetical protein
MLRFSTFLLLAVLSLCGQSAAFAQNFEIGQSVNLQAIKSVGVPLHRKPAPSYLKHVPSGAPATIERISMPWIHVRLVSGELHWVHTKYVQAASSIPNATDSPTSASPSFPIGGTSTTGNGEEAVWASREQCEKVVNQGSRMVPQFPSLFESLPGTCDGFLKEAHLTSLKNLESQRTWNG